MEGRLSLREAAAECRLSRQSAAKWVRRYRLEGSAGLRDRSSRPRRSPRQKPEELVARVEALRRQRWTGVRIALELKVGPARQALDAASAASGRAPHLLEKDIWVVWALSMLFQSELGAHLVFKGGTALSKAHKVITRFSEDVDLTYDIRALAPELVRGVAGGIDAIPPSRSQEKKWSDEIRRELLPAWIRNQTHPVIQMGLERLENVSSRITEDCIFIDYQPVAPASGYALPTVKLEFGARSSGEPSTIIPVRCDMEGLVSSVEFPTAKPRVMNLTRIFWEKATAAHVYCVPGERASATGSRGTSTIWFGSKRPDILPKLSPLKMSPKPLPFTKTLSSPRKMPMATGSTTWKPSTGA